MHLARQGCAVAQTAQVMGIGGHISREIGGVVKSADFGGQLPADHGEARGRAQGAVAVSRVKHHALGRQRLQVWHPDG